MLPYLRTGKRMARKCSEIVIQFAGATQPIDGGGGPANRLWIRLQPEERISVQLMAKTPGKGMQLEPVELDLNLAGRGPQPQQAALGRLRAPAAGRDRGRLDAVHAPRRGRGRLGRVDPILAGWREHYQSPRPYPAGSNGPEQAQLLLELQGRRWLE